MRTPPHTRTDADRCPGVTNPHQALDGALTRIRVPGGMLDAAHATALARIAEEFGDGHIELTSRANVQLRGVHNTDAVAAALDAAALVPSIAHQTVRNIAMSPLTGRVGGMWDVRRLVTDLDQQLCRDHRLADLPGRFLFGLDDGRGDVLAARPDVGILARGDDALLILGGRLLDRAVAYDDAVSTLLDLAREFREVRQGHWRIHELPDATRTALVADARVVEAPKPADTALIGWIDHDAPADDHAGSERLLTLGATLAHGRLTGRQMEFLGAIGVPLIVTAQRSVLICDLTEAVADTVVRVLAPMGFIFDASSPWARMTGCAGAPACARAHDDVYHALENAVRTAEGDAEESLREHWVGCERGCGAPTEHHRLHVATEEGWEIRDV